MSGTYAGGVKASETNKKKYGDNFYREIGAEGGRNGHKGGFFANRELARKAGAKGGRISKRGTKLPDPKPSIINRIRGFLNGV